MRPHAKENLVENRPKEITTLKHVVLILVFASVLIPTELRATEPPDLLGKWAGVWVGHNDFRRGFSVEVTSIGAESAPVKVSAFYCWELAKAKRPVRNDKAGCLPAAGTLDMKKMFMVLHYGKKHQVRMNFRKNYAVWWGQSSISGDFRKVEQKEAAAQ